MSVWCHLTVNVPRSRVTVRVAVLHAQQSSGYLQYPINRVAMLTKVINAVSKDLDIPPVFVNAQNILQQSQAARTRLFLCLLVRAAFEDPVEAGSSTASNVGVRVGAVADAGGGGGGETSATDVEAALAQIVADDGVGSGADEDEDSSEAYHVGIYSSDDDSASFSYVSGVPR